MNVKGPKSNLRFKKGEFLKKEREIRFYTHYHNSGHTRDICFKLHGYPDWFKELRLKKSKERANTTINDTPLDFSTTTQTQET